MGCMLRSLRFNSVPATLDARCLQSYSNTGCCCLIWLLLGFAMAMKPSIYGRTSAVYGSAVVLQPSSRGFEAWLQLEEANGWDLECLLKILEVGFRNAKQQWLLWTFRDAPTACLTSFPMLAHVGVPGSQTPTSFPINYAGTRPCLRIAVYCGPFVSVFNQLLKAPMVGSLRCKPQGVDASRKSLHPLPQSSQQLLGQAHAQSSVCRPPQPVHYALDAFHFWSLLYKYW